MLDQPHARFAAAALLLDELDADPRPAFASAGRAARLALADGTLLAIVRSSDRALVRQYLPGAEPAVAASGALFQCVARRLPPYSEKDLPGWITLADDYAGGTLVLTHEISHFRNRLAVWRVASEPVWLVDRALGKGRGPGEMGWVRATFLNELAARHTAYLAAEGVVPGRGRMPEPGALFACAVAIARYPHVYNDTGLMAALLARGDEAALRDQVGAWCQGLEQFAFFDAGGDEARAHRAYLEDEVALAARGRAAPLVAAEGTL